MPVGTLRLWRHDMHLRWGGSFSGREKLTGPVAHFGAPTRKKARFQAQSTHPQRTPPTAPRWVTALRVPEFTGYSTAHPSPSTPGSTERIETQVHT